MFQAQLIPLFYIITAIWKLYVSTTGSLSQQWKMTLPHEVNGVLGEDVVIPCSFTHPQQRDYSKNITVKWIATHFYNTPFFQCTVNNLTNVSSDECLVADQSLRFSLNGDPKRGNLSLFIRDLGFKDSGKYFCRVELSESHSKWQDAVGTQLNVMEKAQIISLSWVKTPSGPGNGILVCVVKGTPPPSITWLSSNGPINTGVKSNSTQGTSSIPYIPHDVYTCRAENSLGRAVTQFPPGSTFLIEALSVCGVMLLLLLLGVALFCLWKRGSLRCHSEDIQQQSVLSVTTSHAAAVVGEPSIYDNVPEMAVLCSEAQQSYQHNLPEDGKMELVYSTIAINTTSQRPQGGSRVPIPDEGVHYATVKNR